MERSAKTGAESPAFRGTPLGGGLELIEGPVELEGGIFARLVAETSGERMGWIELLSPAGWVKSSGGVNLSEMALGRALAPEEADRLGSPVAPRTS